MKQQISLRLPDTVLRWLDQQAKSRRVGRSHVIRAVLEEHVNGHYAALPDYPYSRVKDLIGSIRGGPPDLGARHRDYLKRLVRGRR